MTHDDAIFAATVDAIERRASAYMLNHTEVEALAEEALVASRWLIEERLRERLAAAIEALEPPNLDGMDRYGAWFEATHDAANIVRSRP